MSDKERTILLWVIGLLLAAVVCLCGIIVYCSVRLNDINV